MSFTPTQSTWAAVLAQPDSATRAQALADLLGADSTIEFRDAADAVIRTITVPSWTVGATAGGKTPIAPSSYTDAALGTGTPVTAVFKAGATEVFRCSCGTGAGNFYRLLANIAAGVPIIPGTFAIALFDPAQPGNFEPSATTAPAISGTAAVGAVLTSIAGVWAGNPVPTVTRQWLRSGVAISGATGMSYAVQQADVGASLTLRETATNSVGSKSSTSNAIGPIAAQPLTFSNVPDPIPLYQGGTYDLAAHVTGGVPPYSGFAVDTGTLPVGVTLDANTGVLTAAVDATVETTGDLVFGVDDSATPVSQPGALPTFGVTSAVGGADLPFTFGHVFKQGDIPAGKFIDSDLTDWQAVPTTYWPDGSVRHAIIAGRATCVAGVRKTTQLARADMNRSGAALTEVDLASALPAVTLVAGADTISLNALVGTAAKHRTVCTGPVMSNWLYRRPVAGSNHLVAWFDVRLYKGGAVEIFPWMENAYLFVPGPTNDVRTYTLTIGGAQKFSQQIDIKHHTRVALIDNTASSFKHWSYWTGTDPQIEPRHDTTYLVATKMVPNYGWAATEAAKAGLTTAFAPNWIGNIPSAMGTAGFGVHIGPLPKWQALFLTSSADPRAYQSTIANGLASGSWSIAYRDESTNEPWRLTDYPDIWGSSVPTATGGTNGTHDYAHQPTLDFLPWLLTGRWFHLEQMLFWHTTNHRQMNYVTREGAKGLVFTGTPRARGWQIRTFAQLLSVLPQSHPCFVNLLASWEANMAEYEKRYVLGTRDNGVWQNNLGSLAMYTGSGVSPYGTEGTYFWESPWQQNAIPLAFGMAWDLDPPQSAGSKASHLVVRDFGYRHPVGMAGDGSPGTYNWRHFAAYKMPYGGDTGNVPLEYYLEDWGAVFAVYQAHAGPGWGPTAVLDPAPGQEIYYANGSEFVTGSDWAFSSALSWPYAALVMAKEHGAVGANEAWERITSAPSFADAAASFAGTPIWGLYPRNA